MQEEGKELYCETEKRRDPPRTVKGSRPRVQPLLGQQRSLILESPFYADWRSFAIPGYGEHLYGLLLSLTDYIYLPFRGEMEFLRMARYTPNQGTGPGWFRFPQITYSKGRTGKDKGL